MYTRVGVIFLSIPYLVNGHGRLTVPTPRAYTYGGGSNAPCMTCAGPVFGSSASSMRCHDVTTPGPITTVTAGGKIHMEWAIEAAHPGDCSVWISYDKDTASPVNWIKIKDLPGCLAADGMSPPQGNIDILLPANLPNSDHAVLRWEWYAVQQVVNNEFYVNCADIKIIGGNPSCPIPTKTTAITDISHLLKNYHTGETQTTCNGVGFYNVYDPNVRPPLNKRSRGPLEWVPESCTGGGGGATPAPTAAPTNPPPTVFPPVIVGGGKVTSTGAVWDGSFAQFVSDQNSFCKCTFGANCKYICSGGGKSGGGGSCDPLACSTGQYTFSDSDGWTIKVSEGGQPQRAFAYAPFCGENVANNVCLPSSAVFTMSFNFQNVKDWGGYIKILFFGDGNDVLGLWPNKGMKLVVFPQGDMPSNWGAGFTMLEDRWYDVTIKINMITDEMVVSITENGATVYSGTGYTGKVSAKSRAQLGVYTWSATSPPFSLKVRNLCADEDGAICKFLYGGGSGGGSGSGGGGGGGGGSGGSELISITCPQDGPWQPTDYGVMVSQKCPQGTGKMYRICGLNNQWHDAIMKECGESGSSPNSSNGGVIDSGVVGAGVGAAAGVAIFFGGIYYAFNNRRAARNRYEVKKETGMSKI